MSETTETAAGSPDEPSAGVPKAISTLTAVIAVQVGFAILYTIIFASSGSWLRREIAKNGAKAKPPKVPCTSDKPVAGCLNVSHDAHAAMFSEVFATVILSALIVFLAVLIRRGNRTGRTMYVALAVIGGMFGYVGSPLALLGVGSDAPLGMRISDGLAAAASIFAIVLLFRPELSAYINLKSPRAVPASGQRRQGLFGGGMFSPRPRPGAAPPASTSGTTQPAKTTSANSTSANSSAKSKSKSRADAESAARGAELARNRAKASKSRRTPD